MSTHPAGAAELEVCPTCTVNSLADAVAMAEPGATITVRGGTYPGGLVIDKSLTLVGVDNPVIDGQEQGTLISAKDADLTISGFTLRSTGSNHDREDSAILVENGKATITDNRIEDALFGIYLKTAHGSVIRNNTILAKPVDIAMRGDGIKIWYCDDVLVENNEASDGRDIILWYSNRGVVRGNDFNRERYGLHLMFSNDIRIENNSLNENSIGLFIMYSRNPLVIGNTLSNNHGPSGGGMGLKDVDNAVVEGNRFVNNQVGAQIDTSPREMGIENYWKDNVFAFNHTAVALQPSVRHNTFTGNNFIDNGQHISIIGGGDLKDITWAVDGRGNYWSDYAGTTRTAMGSATCRTAASACSTRCWMSSRRCGSSCLARQRWRSISRPRRCPACGRRRSSRTRTRWSTRCSPRCCRTQRRPATGPAC